MSAALGLFRLQLIDRQVDRALTQLKDIQKSLDDDSDLVELTGKLEKAQIEFDLVSQALQTAGADTQSQQVKISQAESNLYGGQVHNPKELQDLQNDVVSLKKRLDTLEERELETMSELDTVEKELGILRSSLEALKLNRDSAQSELLASKSVLNKELEKLTQERQATLDAISMEHRRLYEGLRSSKRGVAVVEITDGVCSGCGTILNAALQQNARSSSLLVSCPTCNRILYAA
jgi:hypothetical protein